MKDVLQKHGELSPAGSGNAKWWAESGSAAHANCGYPDHLDDDDYKKADPISYHQLSEAIDEAAFDQISIEDKHCCNDLTLLERFQNKTVIFGAVAIASSRLETVDEVRERLQAAMNHIDRDRLVVAPDCGLGLLTPKPAENKLRVICQAAALIWCRQEGQTVFKARWSLTCINLLQTG